jgi:DNA-binding transcriptional LysR family regulator
VAASADNIATFVEVVRQQSLSAAGRKLGLPKSTISRRLLRLEQELETRLLHRSTRSVMLTSAGRLFYESVFNAVDALDAAVTDLTHSSQEPRGTVRVTAPPDLGRMVMSPMFVAFMERYPDINLDLLFTNRMVDLVQEGVDLALRAGRVPHADLIARKLCDAELHLAESSNGRPRSAAQKIQSLEQEPFVLYRASGRTQSVRLERGVGKRRESVELRVAGRVNVDDYASLAEFVAQGQGLGLLPAVHLAEGVRAGRLQRVFPEWSSRAAHVYLVYASRQQPERVKLLAEFLREAFAAVPHV